MTTLGDETEFDVQQRRWNLWGQEYDSVHEVPDLESALDVLESNSGPSRTALELGVGTGRVAIPLARRGLTVRGIDLSPVMAARLAAKDDGDLVDVTIGDMTKVPAVPEQPLIYCVFSTFFSLLSQERQVECFQSVADALSDDGRFVLECMVPSRGSLLHDRQQAVVRRLDTTSAVITISRNWPDRQIVHFQDILIDNGRVEMLPVEIRYAWPAEIDLMARLAGLTLEKRTAGWRGEEFGPESGMHVSIYKKSITR